MKLIRYNSPLSYGFSDLNRWFRDPFGDVASSSRFAPLTGRFRELVSREDSLATDLFEDNAHYYARFELPGVKREEIDLKLDSDGRLRVRVERASESENTTAAYQAGWGLDLPEDANGADVTAKLENGILTVTVPKAQERKPRVIDVE